jgi:2-C-methyl-D-erythritol 2,4-cyclodiphosphate synthase
VVRRVRVGIGYDSHRTVAGRPLFLGGVAVPSEVGLAGHSDADVLIHAIIDALLGAAKLSDIGRNFPDSDEKYKNISSIILLQKTAELLREKHYTIINIDSIISAEKPKLAPFIPAIENSIAAALNISADSVSVKAKTEEGMGFVGNGTGMAARAVCLIEENIWG